MAVRTPGACRVMREAAGSMRDPLNPPPVAIKRRATQEERRFFAGWQAAVGEATAREEAQKGAEGGGQFSLRRVVLSWGRRARTK